ncbi:CbbQ/NirQ/NorQ C-terminal domain-containing protein, partial [Frankia sp. AgW1.1]
GVDAETAARLVLFGQVIRRLETPGLREVASTRVLIAAGQLITEGLTPRAAARAAIAGPLTDDPSVTAGLIQMIDVYLDEDLAPARRNGDLASVNSPLVGRFGEVGR